MSAVLTGDRIAGAFIPYSSHVDETTLITRDGDLLRIFKVQGVPFETREPADVLQPLEQFNNAMRSAPAGVAVWSHVVQRTAPVTLVGDYRNATAQRFHDQYQDTFTNSRTMASELYLTVVYKPDQSRVHTWFRRAGASRDEQRARLASTLARFDDIANQFSGALSRYGLTALSAYDNAGTLYSEPLELLQYLLTGERQPVRVPRVALYDYLGNASLRVGTETIEIRGNHVTRYAQCVELKDFNGFTESGILDGLLYEPIEYVLTQSFSVYDRHVGEKTLRRQRRHLETVDDGSGSQIDDITNAIDRLINGDFVLGEYHLALTVFGDSVEQARDNTRVAVAAIENDGFIACISTLSAGAAYFSALPANWSQRPRVAHLTSENYAGLASMHTFVTGKSQGNPWGRCLTMFKTPSARAVSFNLHLATNPADQTGDMLPANTRVIGKTGTGKTVLLNMLLMQVQKYDNGARSFTTVFFDKDFGARQCIAKLGGKYLTVANGWPTGFAPLQLDPTPDNVAFLNRLVIYLCSQNGNRVTTRDEQRIAQAIDTVMMMPRQVRRFSTLLQNITESTGTDERENSIAKRLTAWCADGPLAWVFDNDTDVLDFNVATNIGIDGTAFLDNDQVRTPITLYLLHKLKSVIDGRRFVHFMDEAWRWLDDDAFKAFASDEMATIRDKNGLLVMATQSANTVLSSAISAQLNEQVATSIYLPNPAARHDEYVDGFGLTESEFQIVKSLGEDSRTFVVKQGTTSYVAQLDLSGVDMSVLKSKKTPAKLEALTS